MGIAFVVGEEMLQTKNQRVMPKTQVESDISECSILDMP